MLNDILKSRIDRIAGQYGPLADDVASHVTLKLFEKIMIDKWFARQQVGYQIKLAKWEASKYIQAHARYNSHVVEEPQVVDEESGEIAPFFEEFCHSAEAGVERQVIAAEFEREALLALDSLTPQQRRVAKLLMGGFAPYEIAKKMGITQSRVKHLTDAMQAKMRVALAH